MFAVYRSHGRVVTKQDKLLREAGKMGSMAQVDNSGIGERIELSACKFTCLQRPGREHT